MFSFHRLHVTKNAFFTHGKRSFRPPPWSGCCCCCCCCCCCSPPISKSCLLPPKKIHVLASPISSHQVGLTASDRFAQVASMSWDVHITEVFCTLSSQACSVTCPDLVKKSGPAAWFWTTKKEGWRWGRGLEMWCWSWYILDLRRFYRKMFVISMCEMSVLFFWVGNQAILWTLWGMNTNITQEKWIPATYDSIMAMTHTWSILQNSVNVFMDMQVCFLTEVSTMHEMLSPNSTHLSLVEFSPHMRTCFNGWRNDRSQGWASWPQLAAVSSIFVGDFSWNLQLQHDFIEFRHQRIHAKMEDPTMIFGGVIASLLRSFNMTYQRSPAESCQVRHHHTYDLWHKEMSQGVTLKKLGQDAGFARWPTQKKWQQKKTRLMFDVLAWNNMLFIIRNTLALSQCHGCEKNHL